MSPFARPLSRPATALAALAVALLGAASLTPATPAAAAPPVRQAPNEDSTLTWSVRPTPTKDQPERPNFSYDLVPGQRIEDSVRVRNLGDKPLTLTVYASDALTTSTGALDLLPAGKPPTDVGKWIVLDTAAIEVPPKKFVDVPFTMVVPADTESGDHTGGIVTSYRSPGVDDKGRAVVVDRRLGTRMYTRIGGELRPQLEISDLTIGYSGTANPLEPGDVHVTYTVTNTGNVRLSAEQLLVVPGRLGFPGREAVLDQMPELLPANSLTFSADITDVWPTFRSAVTVELRPVPTRDGDAFDPQTPQATASAAAWSVPWSQLVVLLVVAAAVLWVAWRVRRRRRRKDAVQERAVEVAAIVKETLQAVLAAREPQPAADRAGPSRPDAEPGGTPDGGPAA
ncbi:DUF916 domain-containing protein [Phytohabitans sp. ZYX-F-186]|uniref:DUF916 domain-containing protein n=1 Tax=Phytohabitans maris TaxID=3071409 RepID=A0ABU0ZM15_9ACTN|nr:DUF916 domain-containing protein [Phytohabitans sp. ZYX-F-186]MDQ7908050.1 DUF916 domain-containing protein [Phytohabitans sp. ZYX-F-186]